MRDILTQLTMIWVLDGKNGYFVVRKVFGRLVGIYVLNALWKSPLTIVLFSFSCTDLVYSMLQNRKNYGAPSPPAGEKETDIEPEEGVRRREDRGRAKSFGSENPVRWNR